MSKETNKGGRIALIIILIVVLLGAAAGSWYFFVYVPEQEAKEKARLEQLAKEEAERKAKEAEEKKRAEYESLVLSAEEEFGTQNYEVSKTHYQDALGLYPEEEYPKERISQINYLLDSIAAELAKPKIGTIESISRATGRYYVVVSSSIDDDLAMDYAKKLSKMGVSTKILQTKNATHTYFAVSPADFESRAEAEAAISDNSEYSTGTSLWVIRY